MNFPRSGGILLHPTSLPGPYGIGDLGPQAYRFIDWLSNSGGKLWQILPLGPTGYGDSPYQCFSAFAGNPYLISPDFLLRDGLLTDSDLADKPGFSASRVDFGLLIPHKLSLLSRAFDRYQSNPAPFRAEFDSFCAGNAHWLNDYALFMALKESHGGGAWSGWPESLKKRDQAALDSARKSLASDILRFTFYQFVFYRQWFAVREYANQKGIRIIGDIPIFVAYDSADVWANSELFFLDEQGNPTVVAGVPPDGFSATGQLWGNPLYRWEVHKQTGYAWWIKRMKSTFKLFDILRLDHFRGFAGYYEIPAADKTAEHGRWVAGPGADLFAAIDSALGGESGSGGNGIPRPQLPIIAEDLGLITPDVIALLDEFHLPGMKVLQFGFSGPDNPFLPHNYIPNCVAYTGTHDNDTARGWFASAPKHEREFALRYLRTDGSDFAWDLIRAAWSSVAMFAIAPMQDVLNLGGEARMNFPSKLGGNWEWRMKEDDMSDSLAEKLHGLNYLYKR
ncbi:MAG: 4-alpha-glucanotransferase [Chloroflexi bacterium]|nr:4-alpha-glucanotransferase [Chloroflexota bacterium]MBI3339579.1 4-alpha-glucanotransferase [Chloroflexota bacterium]